MLAFVDIEHPKVINDPQKGPPHLRTVQERADNVAAAIGLPCIPVHYLDVNQEWADANGIKALFIGGNTIDWDDYDWDLYKPLQALIRSGRYPTMGFCGGHQFVALTFGMKCGPLGPLEPGEEDLMPEYHPGMRKERGHLSLKPLVPDNPLFEGFPPSGPVLMESHYWDVREITPQFDHLASTDWSPYQVLQHREMPIVITQGHPEAYTDEYPDGKRMIRNFAILTGIINGQ